MKKHGIIFGACLFIATLLPAQNDTDQKIQGILAAAYQPGLALAYFADGKIKTEKYYGFRSLDSRLLVTRRTIFSAASLSKPVLAYLVLQLVDEGRFDLDKPLQEYYTYPDVKSQKHARRVTARHVLSHQTGLPNWRRGKDLTFLRKPGTEFGYSGEGFVWLQRVVEHLTGQSLEALAKKRVFTPLGMARSSFVWQEAFENDYAIPHNNIGKTWRKSKGREANAAYSLQTTAGDYATFLMAIAEGKGLSESSAQAMLTPQVLVKDYPEEKSSVHWGLGIGLQKTPAGTEFWHWGDNGTFKAYGTASSASAEGLVYFANSQNGLSFTPEIVDLYLGTPQPGWDWNGYDHYTSPGFQLLPRAVFSSFVEAKASLEKQGAWSKQEFDADAISGLARRLSYEKKEQDAEEVLRYGLEQFPESVDLHLDLARLYLNTGRRTEAINALRTGLKKDPDNEDLEKQLEALAPIQEGNTVIRYAGHPTARSLSLVGSFNDWQSGVHLFQWIDGYWTCQLDLKPDTYSYQIEVDGVGILDPENPETGFANGRHFSVLVVE